MSERVLFRQPGGPAVSLAQQSSDGLVPVIASAEVSRVHLICQMVALYVE